MSKIRYERILYFICKICRETLNIYLHILHWLNSWKFFTVFCYLHGDAVWMKSEVFLLYLLSFIVFIIDAVSVDYYDNSASF